MRRTLEQQENDIKAALQNLEVNRQQAEASSKGFERQLKSLEDADGKQRQLLSDAAKQLASEKAAFQIEKEKEKSKMSQELLRLAEQRKQLEHNQLRLAEAEIRMKQSRAADERKQREAAERSAQQEKKKIAEAAEQSEHETVIALAVFVTAALLGGLIAVLRKD